MFIVVIASPCAVVLGLLINVVQICTSMHIYVHKFKRQSLSANVGETMTRWEEPSRLDCVWSKTNTGRP